jgi:hypothetical protein
MFKLINSIWENKNDNTNAKILGWLWNIVVSMFNWRIFRLFSASRTLIIAVTTNPDEESILNRKREILIAVVQKMSDGAAAEKTIATNSLSIITKELQEIDSNNWTKFLFYALTVAFVCYAFYPLFKGGTTGNVANNGSDNTNIGDRIVFTPSNNTNPTTNSQRPRSRSQHARRLDSSQRFTPEPHREERGNERMSYAFMRRRQLFASFGLLSQNVTISMRRFAALRSLTELLPDAHTTFVQWFNRITNIAIERGIQVEHTVGEIKLFLLEQLDAVVGDPTFNPSALLTQDQRALIISHLDDMLLLNTIGVEHPTMLLGYNVLVVTIKLLKYHAGSAHLMAEFIHQLYVSGYFDA